MTPEGKVKTITKRALARLVFSGTTRKAVYQFMPVQNGMGAPGLDFYNCIGGGFVAIETKAFGKKPTPRQETTIQSIRDAGGLVFVIDREEHVANMIAILCHKFGLEYGPEK